MNIQFLVYFVNVKVDIHLVEALVSLGNELNFVDISVTVMEFCLPNVGIVLCGIAAVP